MAITNSQINNIPIFIGLKQEDLTNIATNTRLGLKHYKKGSAIVEDGKKCSSLFIILNGRFKVVTYNDSHSYHVEESMQAIHMVEPDKLFGLTTSYHSTYQCISACEVIELPKEELMRLIDNHLIIKINLLNAICMKAQKSERFLWGEKSTDITSEVIRFIKLHVSHPAGQKFFHITMTQLAKELNCSTTDISKALKKLDEAERIILKRGLIEIPALQLL